MTSLTSKDDIRQNLPINPRQLFPQRLLTNCYTQIFMQKVN